MCSFSLPSLPGRKSWKGGSSLPSPVLHGRIAKSPDVYSSSLIIQGPGARCLGLHSHILLECGNNSSHNSCPSPFFISVKVPRRAIGKEEEEEEPLRVSPVPGQREPSKKRNLWLLNMLFGRTVITNQEQITGSYMAGHLIFFQVDKTFNILNEQHTVLHVCHVTYWQLQ